MKKCLGRTSRRRKKKIKSTSESCDVESYILLCKWMGENGYKATKTLHPHYFPESGRGLMADKSIKPGDIIVSIPECLLVTPQRVLSTDLGSCIKRHFPSASGHQILSLFLLFEQAKDDSSFWQPYIRTLPKSYSVPAFSSADSLPPLPAFLRNPVADQLQRVADSFSQLSPVFAEVEALHPFLEGSFTQEAYRWAWCAVNTRCVYMECRTKECTGEACIFHMALAPFLDLLNHSADVQVSAGFNSSCKQYEIVSQCSFKKFSQVFINYGPHDNRKLFMEYGFVAAKNMHDAIPFSLDDIITPFCELFPTLHSEKKIHFISHNNLIKNTYCSCDGLSWNMIVILQILTSQNDEKCWMKYFCDQIKPASSQQQNIEKLRNAVLSSKLKEYLYTIPVEVPVINRDLMTQINSLISNEKQILIKNMDF